MNLFEEIINAGEKEKAIEGIVGVINIRKALNLKAGELINGGELINYLSSVNVPGLVILKILKEFKKYNLLDQETLDDMARERPRP